ncbi:hypothetical protein Nepgr_000492 [Nepenthes gracilis]|uniref:Phototropic-responsive NPH3 family protein n=1 Tax=Nepenthes gracilis TaxID=150966 RepID=A0AAD3RWW5_NEPGR|nr:hypothetical protein Nepgr_000492 [Nepenthes gracilis]
MDVCCDLEVDVNGEGVFMVDKEVLSSYSGRLSKLFCNSTSTKTKLKVIFHDFPGGIEIFELVARFCYNKGCICILPLNITLLNSAAHFMEMNESVSGRDNLTVQTEKLLSQINYWPWSDLLGALKQSQDFPSAANSVQVLQQFLDAIVERLALATEASPCPSISSHDSCGLRVSCDSRSTESLKTSCSGRTMWWFEELVVLNCNMVEMVTKCMIIRRFDHAILSRFLFYYQKVNLVHAKYEEKRKIIEMAIRMLYSLDQSAVSYKSLFGILRSALNLDISTSSRSRLEGMIGSRMDEATLDNLLLPSQCGANHLYDVNLVLRFLKWFSNRGLRKISSDRVGKVANLVDLYLAEVAPDPSLKPSEFIALAMALPDSARESYDGIYHAIDIYLEVHLGLSEDDKLSICSVLSYEKLSSEACLHIAQNRKLPSRSAVQALTSQQYKLQSLLIQDPIDPESCCASPCRYLETGIEGGKDESDDLQVVVYAKKLDVMTENEKLRAHLQGMNRRVRELEKVCRKMQSQMTKIMKSRSLTSHISSRSLPKLCS